MKQEMIPIEIPKWRVMRYESNTKQVYIEYDRVTINAYEIHGAFAITDTKQTGYEKYVITHIPTGAIVYSFKYKIRARLCITLIQSQDIVWSAIRKYEDILELTPVLKRCVEPFISNRLKPNK